MSITEQIRVRFLSEETYSLVGASALIMSILLLPSDIDKSLFASPQRNPYYKALEASDSSNPECKITTLSSVEKLTYRPKTALGERLMALRERAISKGLILLNADEIIEEVNRRRGEAA